MSTTYDTLAAARPFPDAPQPTATVSGLRLKDLPYVGVHRRPDGQGRDADSLRPPSGHRPRHRRLVPSAS